MLPNGRRATFYDFWAGHRKIAEFRDRLRTDLAAVFMLLQAGMLEPQIAAQIPLTRAGEALRLAETRTTVGKVVLVPDTTTDR